MDPSPSRDLLPQSPDHLPHQDPLALLPPDPSMTPLSPPTVDTTVTPIPKAEPAHEELHGLDPAWGPS